MTGQRPSTLDRARHWLAALPRPVVKRSVAVGLAALALGAAALLLTSRASEDKVVIPFGEHVLKNGPEVLHQARELLQAEAVRAGADLSLSRCWLAQDVFMDGRPDTRSDPKVVCGPALFPDREDRWVTGEIELQDRQGGIGRFSEFTTTGPLPSMAGRNLGGTRYYGSAPPDDSLWAAPPVPPEGSMVLKFGKRLVGVADLINEVEGVFRRELATTEERFVVQEDARCWVTDSLDVVVLCGPVLLERSGTSEDAYVSYETKPGRTTFWSTTRVLEDAAGLSSRRTVQLANYPATQLFRPDGTAPPAILITYPGSEAVTPAADDGTSSTSIPPDEDGGNTDLAKARRAWRDRDFSYASSEVFVSSDGNIYAVAHTADADPTTQFRGMRLFSFNYGEWKAGVYFIDENCYQPGSCTVEVLGAGTPTPVVLLIWCCPMDNYFWWRGSMATVWSFSDQLPYTPLAQYISDESKLFDWVLLSEHDDESFVAVECLEEVTTEDSRDCLSSIEVRYSVSDTGVTREVLLAR